MVKGACMAKGACVAKGGMHGEGGACMAGETATAADGMHPTGMHSCFTLLSRGRQSFLLIYLQIIGTQVVVNHHILVVDY